MLENILFNAYREQKAQAKERLKQIIRNLG